MVTEEQVRDSLDKVLVPGSTRSLVGLNLVRQVTVSDGRVDITLAATALSDRVQEWVRAKVTESLPGVGSVAVSFVEAKPSELNQVGQIIAVVSGKGGVGKSLVSSLMAVALRRLGHEVGILDADITGPTIPAMFGIKERPSGTNTGILPVLSRSGIAVMSINLLLPEAHQAVIWRGPLISRTITQFWQDVLWGKLDYLVVDLPPGTADAALTVMQSIPISGVVIVFTPQSLTMMIVQKAVDMARQMKKPVLGVVENMSYLYVPELDRRLELFGPSKGKIMAQATHAPLLARLPVDPQLATLCDEGAIERYDADVLPAFSQALVRTLRRDRAEKVPHEGGR